MLITFFLGLFFFLGWTGKGVYQAFSDWRLTQRLNRVHFAAAEFDVMKRENELLHKALNAYKENGRRVGGAGVRNEPQSSHPPKASIDPDYTREVMRQIRGEEL